MGRIFHTGPRLPLTRFRYNTKRINRVTGGLSVTGYASSFKYRFEVSNQDVVGISKIY